MFIVTDICWVIIRGELLKLSSGIEDLGQLDWHQALALLLAWIIIFLCLIKGIKSTGKVVYVTATLPYLVLSILLVRGLTLPGATQGLYFYLYPDFQKLKNARVWGDAASQIFYSLGPAWGILITYSSYNKFKHNFIRDSVVTSFVCTGTSCFAGLVIFSVIGFMAHVMQQDIETVVKAGPGLIFVAYPEALAQMPVAPLWSILFFIMVLTVAIDSMFSTFEVVIVAIIDEIPRLLSHRVALTAVMCGTWFFLTLPQCTQGGIYILTLMDWYVGTFPPLLVGLFETVTISYIYGYSRFENDVKSMLGVKPNIYWKVTCMGVAPLVILAIIIFNAAIFRPVSFGSYSYPHWAGVVGILITLVSCICLPLLAVIVVLQKRTRRNKSGTKRTWVEELFKPEVDWDIRRKVEKGPADSSLEADEKCTLGDIESYKL